MFYGASAFNQQIGGWSFEAPIDEYDQHVRGRGDRLRPGRRARCGAGRRVNLGPMFLATSCESNAVRRRAKGRHRQPAMGPSVSHFPPVVSRNASSAHQQLSAPSCLFSCCLRRPTLRRKKKDETYDAAASRVLCERPPLLLPALLRLQEGDGRLVASTPRRIHRRSRRGRARRGSDRGDAAPPPTKMRPPGLSPWRRAPRPPPKPRPRRPPSARASRESCPRSCSGSRKKSHYNAPHRQAKPRRHLQPSSRRLRRRDGPAEPAAAERRGNLQPDFRLVQREPRTPRRPRPRPRGRRIRTRRRSRRRPGFVAVTPPASTARPAQAVLSSDHPVARPRSEVEFQRRPPPFSTGAQQRRYRRRRPCIRLASPSRAL